MSVIRLRSENPERIIDLSDKILNAWRGYTDEAAYIFAETEGVPHNTITPIARKKYNVFEMDLVLRNNITSEKHPLGVYHPHNELHNIKKENIGLIEVMGLAVLPSRLDRELRRLADFILNKYDIKNDEELSKHALWTEGFIKKYSDINKENINEIIQKEVGLVFEKVLECSGVFKCTEQGRKYFDKFISSVN